jgi:hypothetical protein
MGITKKIKLDSLFVFLFLVVFPFGQVIRLSFNIAGFNVPLQPIDVIVGLGALYEVLFEKEKPKVFKYLMYFLASAIFSYVLSIYVFKFEALYGLFYLARITAYIFFLNYVWNFVKREASNKHLLLDSLLVVSVFSAIFGWVQFFTIPDLKPFSTIGWDMHLYRLVGTFLDPPYLGLIIIFGLIISISRFIENKEKKYIALISFLLISLAFTYSRASYLAFLGATFVMALSEKKLRKVALLGVGLLVMAFFLPTVKNHSIEITRMFSVTARLSNYKEAISVSEKVPVFGIGFDNYCAARNKYIGKESFSSHSCSGSDSSLLLILATTGAVGLMVFAGSVFGIFRSLSKSREAKIFVLSSIALFIHSLLSNSLFFPWIMGYMIILLAVSVKE